MSIHSGVIFPQHHDTFLGKRPADGLFYPISVKYLGYRVICKCLLKITTTVQRISNRTVNKCRAEVPTSRTKGCVNESYKRFLFICGTVLVPPFDVGPNHFLVTQKL